MLIDSHCHLDRLDLTPFEGRLEGALEAAAAKGVEHFLCVAVDLERWPAMAAAMEPFANVSLSVGVHPSEEQGRAPTVEALLERARHPRVVAIGETGLDYHYGADSQRRQQDYFRTHIAAARACGKPLIIHTREAKADTLGLLREEGADQVGG
ncbi:MAG: TatD family hydrolase, partial [Candidatus Competibacteraceae bacterium]|nr:TatD family hydrolase [Candidatus Competibacteraceae bacterium]